MQLFQISPWNSGSITFQLIQKRSQIQGMFMQVFCCGICVPRPLCVSWRAREKFEGSIENRELRIQEKFLWFWKVRPEQRFIFKKTAWQTFSLPNCWCEEVQMYFFHRMEKGCYRRSLMTVAYTVLTDPWPHEEAWSLTPRRSTCVIVDLE